ncbi:hypothetical protein MANES_09G170600v8 [Manihot esculenta]|uniref:Uncharacterized protein n=1 Tax=Manihot esculenta TaxID=3983 RepID=A0A2C9VCS9_MANES|nr:hypothetical protein MANES_09G170600v8 [Manihot esculenta]
MKKSWLCPCWGSMELVQWVRLLNLLLKLGCDPSFQILVCSYCNFMETSSCKLVCIRM